MRANKVFQFLRGAIRSAYGIENLRDKTFLIIGMSNDGQDLVNKLCLDGVDLRFQEPKVSNYHKSFAVCRDIDVYRGQKVDVIIDFFNRYVCVKDKAFPLGQIGDDPYTQGIHEFYM